MLSTSPGYEIKPLAIGLAAGIVLDATVIRALLVPALMRLLGDANWWMPAARASSPAAARRRERDDHIAASATLLRVARRRPRGRVTSPGDRELDRSACASSIVTPVRGSRGDERRSRRTIALQPSPTRGASSRGT